MAVCNLIEYSSNYSKASGSLWQYYKDEPDDNLEDSKSFKSTVKITADVAAAAAAADNKKYVKIIVSLKY